MTILNILLYLWTTHISPIQCLEQRQGAANATTTTSTSTTNGPFFDYTTQPICGYINQDINAPYVCGSQYCTTVPNYFACCESVSGTNFTQLSSDTWYYTESLTTSATKSGINLFTFDMTSYSYQSCGWYTACYPSFAQPLTTSGADLVCLDSIYARCQTLTMSHDHPNATYTAFRCAEIDLTQALYSTWTYPSDTTSAAAASASAAAAASSSSALNTPSNHVPTRATQSSLPASAAATMTAMPSQTGGVERVLSTKISWMLLALGLLI